MGNIAAVPHFFPMDSPCILAGKTLAAVALETNFFTVNGIHMVVFPGMGGGNCIGVGMAADSTLIGAETIFGAERIPGIN